MDTVKMLDAEQVKECLGASKATAYKIIRQLNDELKKNVCKVARGRVGKHYFEQTYFAVPAQNRERGTQ